MIDVLAGGLWPLVALLAPPSSSEGDIDWLLDGPWAKLALLITVAIAVLTVGNLMVKRRGASVSGGRFRGDFDLAVAKMESLPVTPIADAQAGPVRLIATLSSSNGSLGGQPGRECVWRNRYGGARSTAVSAELVVAKDDTGQVAIEDLEGARVLAPKDEPAGKTEFASLLLGDEVELLGYFAPEKHGAEDDPGERIYGIMGVDSQVQVRLTNRPPAESQAEAQAEPSGEAEPTPE